MEGNGSGAASTSFLGGTQSPVVVVIGADGNLYGVDYGQSLFELTAPESRNGVWEYRLLNALNGTTEGEGIQGITLDAKGNIYGATENGGDMSICQQQGCGTVFELKRPAKNGGKWSFSMLYAFTGSSTGEEPFAGVTLDQKGNLCGTTHSGGTYGYGVTYRLTPPAKKGQPWNETVLYSFDRIDNEGNSPAATVTFDSAGNIYGTTISGGDPNCQAGIGCGVVYELSPPAKKGKGWTYTTLYAFQGGSDDGAVPSGPIVFDSSGNLYGTTEAGGQTNGGTAYRVSPPGSGGTWTETVLYAFPGIDGTNPIVPEGLTWGKWNDLYGVTMGGGLCQGCGTAFEIRP